MKLLMENWREYLTKENIGSLERKYYGDWVEKIPQIHKDILERGIPRDSEFELVSNRGMHRIVIKPKNNTEFVIKLLRDPRGAFMNRVESEYQTRFRNLFPKVYKHGAGAHGTEWDWIVVETVPKPIEEREFINFFPELEQVIDKYLPENEQENVKWEFADFLQNVIRFIKTGFKDPEGNILRSKEGHIMVSPWHNLRRWLKIGSHFSPPSPEEIEQLSKNLLAAVEKNPLLHDLSMLSTKLNVDVGDLKPANFGITNNNRLVLLDASILSDPYRAKK